MQGTGGSGSGDATNRLSVEENSSSNTLANDIGYHADYDNNNSVQEDEDSDNSNNSNNSNNSAEANDEDSNDEDSNNDSADDSAEQNSSESGTNKVAAEKRRQALQHHRGLMYERLKDSIMSAAQNEIDDFNRYSGFESASQIHVFEDDGESTDVAQDLEILGA